MNDCNRAVIYTIGILQRLGGSVALEQWEIELRKQLEGTRHKRKENWEDKLRKDISEVKETTPTPPRSNCTIPFAMLITFLVLSLIFVVNYKNDWFKKCELPEQVLPIPTDNSQQVLTELKQIRIDMEKMQQENKTKYDELQKKIKWNGDRIALIGTMHNENWLVLRNEGPRSCRFLYFNADWTISGMPQYLELTPDDKAFLERYQKKD